MPANSVVRGLMFSSQEFLKRGFDFIGATAGLILLSPLICLASLAIKLDSRGPVLYRPKYYNLSDGVFQAFEFRCTTASPGRTRPADRDRDVTRMGRILQRSGIDKIPQLINVLRGDMSIVGPHPFATAAGAIYRARIAPDRLRNVRPGIISWAQVRRGSGKTTPDASGQRIEDDCYYIENHSFLFDMKILSLVLLMETTYT
jgi:lipopolysaccharide/colanic/teichoic acid biosynthesis glycosyltransferase